MMFFHCIHCVFWTSGFDEVKKITFVIFIFIYFEVWDIFSRSLTSNILYHINNSFHHVYFDVFILPNNVQGSLRKVPVVPSGVRNATHAWCMQSFSSTLWAIPLVHTCFLDLFIWVYKKYLPTQSQGFCSRHNVVLGFIFQSVFFYLMSLVYFVRILYDISMSHS